MKLSDPIDLWNATGIAFSPGDLDNRIVKSISNGQKEAVDNMRKLSVGMIYKFIKFLSETSPKYKEKELLVLARKFLYNEVGLRDSIDKPEFDFKEVLKGDISNEQE